MNGYELVRLQANQVKKTGDSMSGNLTMTGNAQVVGNATTATRLQADRTIKVGKSPAKVFNGTTNVEFTLYEIGAAGGANAGFKTQINAGQWQAEGDYYKVRINHKLNAEILIVTAIDTNTKESVFLPYKIIDNNNIDVQIKDNSLNLTVTIVSNGLAVGGGAAANVNNSYKATINRWTAHRNIFKATVTHNLNSNVVFVGGTDTANSESVLLGYKKLNNNELEVYIADNNRTVEVVVIAETLGVGIGGGNFLPLAGGTMTGSILVNQNNAIDLGSDANRWRNVYTNTLNVSANANINGGVYAKGRVESKDYLEVVDATTGNGTGIEIKADDIQFQMVNNKVIVNPIMSFTTKGADREIYVYKHFQPHSSKNDGLWCGQTNGNRWWAVSANQGTIQTSDKNCKSDIREVSYNENSRTKDIKNVPSSKDFYNLIKDMKMVTYVMKQEGKEDTQERCDSSQLSVGFLAQDVKKINEDIAKYFIVEDGEFIGLNNYHYTSAIHIALQESIKKIEEKDLLIQDLVKRIEKLEGGVSN